MFLFLYHQPEAVIDNIFLGIRSRMLIKDNDFSKQKIAWARLMRISKNDYYDFPRFAIIDKDKYIIDSLCFITGPDIYYLLGFLNSDLGKYYFFNDIPILDNGGMQMRQQYIETMPIPLLPDDKKHQITDKIKILLKEYSKEMNDDINKLIYTLYGFNVGEQQAIKLFLKNKKNEIIGVSR